MKREQGDLLNEALLLLELALIVGRMSGYDLTSRCREFLRILMARKNLSYGAVWIRADLLHRNGDAKTMELVKAMPRSRRATSILPLGHPAVTAPANARFRIIRHDEPAFADSVAGAEKTTGCLVIFRLGEIGVLKLYSADETSFVTRQANQLASVIETFTISIEGALSELRFRREVEEREEIEAMLQKNERMQALGQLTGGVAHDFNNLLGAIRGCAEFIELSGEPEPEMVQGILDATRRGADLTQRLLAYARQQPLKAEAVDLAELIASVMVLLRRSIGRNIDIEFDAAPELWPALADPRQVEDALLNLAINARDAMPRGGRLSITCRNVALSDDNCGEAAPGDYVALTVRDEGVGMSEEVKAKIFEPFFTTKGSGNGLGLSTIYGFAQQSGGALTVESAPEAGAAFTLYLPKSGASPARRAAAAAEEAPQGAGERVLVVEDDPTVRALTVRSLHALGYHPSAAAEAAGALTLADEDGPFDLLLSDIALPGGLSGPGIFAELRADDPTLPVVFMSGFAQEAAAEIGDRPVLDKPFSRAELARALRDALSTRALPNS